MAEEISTFPVLPEPIDSTASQFGPQGQAGFASQFQGDIYSSRGRFGNGTDFWVIDATSMQSANFVTGVSGCQILYNGNVEFNDGYFRGDISAATGTFASAIAIGTSPNWFKVDASGNIWSGANTLALAEVDKFAVTNTGTLYAYNGVIAGTLTIGGRLATIIGGAINADGDFINELINTKLNTDAQTILGSFTFGVSGAIQIGTYVNGVSGDLKISPTGILGRNSANATTFSIDATTGNATFAGSLSAASGTLGSITAGTFTGISISIGSANNIFKADANGIYLGNATFASAPFSVSMAGATKMTSATIGNWTVNTTSIYTGTEDHSGYTANAGDITIYSDGSDSSIHAKNFYIDTAGNFTAVGGTLDGTSSLGGRLASTLASAIDASGHFADSAINTATGVIVTPFTFGVSGALQIGTYENGVSGDLKVSPNGILARSSTGATTFSIDGTTGVAVLNGLVVGTNVGLGIARQTFTAEPTTPYYVGDLWAAGSSGDLKRCITQRLTGAYQAGDWDLASKYTDDSGVTTIIGSTVTTSFVNALNVNAATVSASISITTPTITGGTITIGTGDNVFIAGASGIQLGDSTFADAPFRVSMAGALNATSATITGALTAGAGSSLPATYISGTVDLDNTNISAQGWTNTCVFSATDYRVVAWDTGVITTAAGTAYNITGANTGNMSASTSYYIYLDIAVSETLLQVTTTAGTAVGSGKILVATAYANSDTTSKAQFQVFGGAGGVRLFVDNISANSASTNEFISNSAQIANLVVTDAKINTLAVSKLTTGTFTSKTMTLAVAGGTGDSYLNAGKTDFDNTVSGFILGLDDSDSDKAKFYIGNTTDYFNFNGANVSFRTTLADAITIDYGSNILLQEGGSIKFTSVTAPTACTATLSATGIIDSYSETNVDAFYSISGTELSWGQSFNGLFGTLDKCKFYVKKTGSPTGNAIAKIYAHSGVYGTSSIPTGDALAISDNLDVSGLVDGDQLATFTFSGVNKITFVQDTKYVLVIYYASSAGGNYLSIGLDSSASSADGNACEYVTPTGWEYFASDLAFYVYNDAGLIDNGTHSYAVTFVNPSGETEIGAESNTVTVDATHKQINLSNIPVSSSGSVTARKIYRGLTNSNDYRLLTTINDNVTTTYTDEKADADLTGLMANFKENNAFGKIFIDGIKSLSLGEKNTYVGQYAGFSNSNGFWNTAVGCLALNSITEGTSNTAMGRGALYNHTVGNLNSAFGGNTLEQNIDGDQNTAIGYGAGYSGTHGDGNIFLGYYAGYYETGSNKLFIDNQERTDEATTRTSALIYGVFNATPSSQTLTLNAAVDALVSYSVAGTKVVGTQVSAIGLNAKSDADKITDIITALRAHGLIGPNA